MWMRRWWSTCLVLCMCYCSLDCVGSSVGLELPAHFPPHLLPHLSTATRVSEWSGVKSHTQARHTVAMRYSTPQGMHVSLEVFGAVVMPRLPHNCLGEAEAWKSDKGERGGEGGKSGCFINVLVVLDLPVGVLVDPYELKSRHEYGWDNVIVHTSAASIPHLSAEVFTRGASAFTLAVELLGVPLVESKEGNSHNQFSAPYRVVLPIHLRYSSDFAPSDPLVPTASVHSQCGPHRHQGNALVSRITLPLVFVGHCDSSWTPGIAFATSSSNSYAHDGIIDAELYQRGEGVVSGINMANSHRLARYSLSSTIAVDDINSIWNGEYEALLTKEISRMPDIASSAVVNGLGGKSAFYLEDIFSKACLYLPINSVSSAVGNADEVTMEVYLHMPVPDEGHVALVIIITCMTIFTTTMSIIYVLIKPQTMRTT